MKKKQSRPLFIPKPEQGDFPFDYNDIDEIKPIDCFRMYNCIKMMFEKLIKDKEQRDSIQQNMDNIFKIFIQKDKNPPETKIYGRKNSPFTYQKQQFWDYVEGLNRMGFTYKQISERLQVHYVQISTHHMVKEDQSASQKKTLKEQSKFNKAQHDVFYSEDEQ